MALAAPALPEAAHLAAPRTGHREPWPVVPALAALLPGGVLRPGTVVAVEGATSLALALLAGAATAGAWCGVVGVPGVGLVATAEHGVDLDRLVLVAHPGDAWTTVVATLVEAVDVVLVRPAGRRQEADVRRLAARIREREAVVVALGGWDGADVRLTVARSRWEGLGAGHGHLRARRVEVQATGRGAAARPRSTVLWLPGPSGRAEPADVATGAPPLAAVPAHPTTSRARPA
ncbi:MAG TPA: hypothetical protein VNA12_05450 [Mycobacteriales bacterium]|nr:hypothetical protein [Mycobacteriales bacterium]